MKDMDLGVTWADIIEQWAKLPKPKKETALMNEGNWAKAKHVLKQQPGTISSPFHLCQIPVEVHNWATQIYLIPDPLLERVKDFAEMFGGEAADNLLKRLALETTKEKVDGDG